MGVSCDRSGLHSESLMLPKEWSRVIVLGVRHRRSFTRSFSGHVTGLFDRSVVLTYYLPTLLTALVSNTNQGEVMRYICRIFFAYLLFPCVMFSGCGALGRCEATQQMTPLLLEVHDAPVPFRGSDGLIHMVYELWLTNVSSGEARGEEVEVSGDGVVLQTLDATAVSHRLQPAGLRESSEVLAKGSVSELFLNVALPAGTAIPKQLSHKVKAH